MGHAEVKRTILARVDALFPNEINDVETYLSILKNKTNDLPREAITMCNLLVESLWKYKIQYRSGILYINCNSDSDTIKL